MWSVYKSKFGIAISVKNVFIGYGNNNDVINVNNGLSMNTVVNTLQELMNSHKWLAINEEWNDKIYGDINDSYNVYL